MKISLSKNLPLRESLKALFTIFLREQKKIFRLKNFEKPLFLAVFGEKFDKSSEHAELNRLKAACNITYMQKPDLKLPDPG